MKKVVALFLCFLIFSGVLPMGFMVPVMAESTEKIESLEQREVYFSVDRYASTTAEKNFEELIYNAATNCDTKKIDVASYKYTVKKVSELINMCKDKHPDLYHLTSFGLTGMDTDKNGNLDSYEKVEAIYLKYYFDSETYDKYNLAAAQAAAEMLADIKGNKNLNDLEKLLLLHDRIAVRCEYDYEGYQEYEEAYAKNPNVRIDDCVEHESFSMYGVLVNGKAVCEGYSKAYQYMLNELGIENYLCSSTQLCHVWNIVKLNGKFYHVDITFDDPSAKMGYGSNIATDRTGRVEHTNFLRSSDGIYSQQHEAYDYDTTPQDDTYDEYFWQDSQTAFTLFNNEIYYINNDTENLMLWKGGDGSQDTTLYSVDYEWGNWAGNFSCLSGDSKHLYFNSNNTVYEYDVTNNVAAPFHALQLAKGKAIYGFKADHAVFFCDITSGPNYYASEKEKGAHRHKYSDERIDISIAAKKACEQVVKNMVYTGKAIKFNINIFAGGKQLNAGTDFTVKYENNTNVGTAKVSIHGINDYDGWDFETFKITAKKISKATVIGVTDKTYTGKKIYQSIIVKDGSKTLVYKKDYKLTYNNNTATGKASVKISGIGNYKSSLTKYFYIHPKKVTKVKVKKATSSTITISWKKLTSGSGYAVLCSTSKKGNYKTVGLIDSIKKTTFTHKKLAKNKTYYYKIVAYKTVSGKKYSSVASDVLTAKTATATPKITYCKNISKKTVVLKWSKVSGAEKYQVYMKTSGGKYKRVYSGSKLNYTAKKLKKGKTYYFKVRTYKTSHKVKAYSSYSATKKVKVTK